MTQEFQKQKKIAKFKAIALVAPLLLFIGVFFIAPIGVILIKGVYNPKLINLIPKTINKLQAYNYKNAIMPNEESIAEFLIELKYLSSIRQSGILAEELNRKVAGFGSLIKKTARVLKLANLEKVSKHKEYLLSISNRWKDARYWMAIKRAKQTWTLDYALEAMDYTHNLDNEIVKKPITQQIYLPILLKTFYMAIIITLLTILLGYPSAYYLSTISKSKANLLMIFVLLPFWTSLLVRIVAWLTLLQEKGVINDTLLSLNLINKPLDIVFNQFATIITMTHILLPFMILPLYASMRAIDSTYLKASASLGANPFITFYKIYLPLTLSGLSAGAILVFIISIGYYITPALIGGVDGQMISNLIEFHMRTSNNWELASAIGGGLLIITLMLYWLYNKLVGIDSLRLG